MELREERENSEGGKGRKGVGDAKERGWNKYARRKKERRQGRRKQKGG